MAAEVFRFLVAAREDGRAGGGAHGAGGGEAVEVGGTVASVAIAGEVAVAEIVGQDEDDVGWGAWGDGFYKFSALGLRGLGCFF